MAVCKRCGTMFDYDKWDGVCPKCCLYNRPPGAREDDECWMNNYNVDDNSYRFPTEHTASPHEVTRHSEKAARNNAYNRANSPIQKKPASAPVQQARPAQNRGNQTQRKSSITKIILVFVIIYLIIMFIVPMIYTFI